VGCITSIRWLLHERHAIFGGSQRLWEKGETSGHFLEVVQVQTDCDRDALLVSAWPRGPVCHTGSGSCFGEVPETPDSPMAFLARLEEVISARMAMRPEGSYTAKLLAAGWARIAQKVGEEGLEAALAGAGGSDHEVIEEVSDLLFHVLVMLKARGLSFESVVTELRARHELRVPPASNQRSILTK
jgi:phosphoribosyl-ATP pyrophosphohydrolase/phosphoribosyl-AMP cyclohydrolase